MYTLAELKSVTRNFRPDVVYGEGGFGRLYRGWVDERTLAPSKVGSGIRVAVKKYNPEGLGEWQSEVKFLGKVSHPNLMRLLGYCWEDNQYLLVYEYMQGGSLGNRLFGRRAESLPWDVRLKIAIGAARGVDFLHSSEKSVIYRDFKSSKILLDADFNAKLSDFGLAKLGPAGGNSHVTTRVIGTYGYAAPEYIATEMLTGLQAFDNTRPSGQQNLVGLARPSLRDKRKLRKIMDSRLEGRYPLKAATQAAELILKCLEGDPKARPSMDEVLKTLEQIDTIREKRKEAKASTSSRADPPRGSGSRYSPSTVSRTH
ncbi:hypothetical protein EUGRSUZ_L01420 [Eucalyptus grandis]|uniref:non-specific serine/threonine protein kinase n=1 Tax=Eucalyptus grandis TaxID=71139 RepID=A0A058ZUG1_EUCGR|nr:hypothetical protein EUGRSUZ_L01420 [Eucalyptus grandis]